MFKKLVRKKLDEFIKNQATDQKTLDVGCGNSRYVEYFPNRIGFDVQKNRGVDVVGDVHNMPFDNESFDAILCTEVLEHLKNPQKAILEMRRVLKDGGKLILTTRFIFPLHDVPNDYWRFTKYGLKELFKDWRIDWIEEEYGTIDTLGVLFQRIGFQSRSPFSKFFKIFFFVMPILIKPLKIFIKKEYGDIGKTAGENNILSSGYYLVCRKI